MSINTFSYKGSTYEGIGLKYLHSQVLELLKVASRYEGNAYGGYVRDVITKIRYNDFSSTLVKDLDIWFKTETDRDNFISHFNCYKLVPAGYNDGSEKSVCRSDGCGVINYLLKDQYGDNLILVDTVVCPVFPVWDFSVNFLLYDYSRDILRCMGDRELTKTLVDIRNHKAILSKDAEHILTYKRSKQITIRNHNMDISIDGFITRVQKFIKNGWIIESNTGCTLSDSENGLIFNKK
jgi:hypothetical protein